MTSIIKCFTDIEYKPLQIKHTHGTSSDIRLKELTDAIHSLAFQMLVGNRQVSPSDFFEKKPFKVVINSFCNTPVSYIKDDNLVVAIPVLFLLDADDIDPKFLLTTEEDLKRLQDEEFIDAFIYHLSEVIKDPDLEPKKLTLKQRETLKIFLSFIGDKKKSSQAKIHTLAHEIAHHFLGHTEREKEGPKSFFSTLNSEDALKPLSLAASGILAYATLGFGAVLGLGIAVGAGLYYRKSKSAKRSREDELAADTLAVKTVRNTEGFSYLFGKIKSHLVRFRNSKSRLNPIRLLITPTGEPVTFGLWGHPGPQMRIDHGIDVLQRL